MKITIEFDHPYLEEEGERNRLNLFFVLEASFHKLQSEQRKKAAARCAFLMAYYLFVPLTPPASAELAVFYIDQALEWDEMAEYQQWKRAMEQGN